MLFLGGALMEPKTKSLKELWSIPLSKPNPLFFARRLHPQVSFIFNALNLEGALKDNCLFQTK